MGFILVSLSYIITLEIRNAALETSWYDINKFFIWFQWMFILCQEMKMFIMYLKILLNIKNLDWQSCHNALFLCFPKLIILMIKLIELF